MKHLFFLMLVLATGVGYSQGPPITLDKPIMLGAKKGTARAYLKYGQTELLEYQALVLEGDYNITKNFAVGAEVPVMLGSALRQRVTGDVSAMLKYQFLTLDARAKSFRVAVKAKHGFPTGRSLETPVLGMGHHMTYGGVLAAYESLKLGVQSEIGYSYSYGADHLSNLNYKFGVGLPVLKPSYPVNQVTLYLESEGQNFMSHHDGAQYGFYAGPGLQYARKKFTFDFALQFPVSQQLQPSLTRLWTGLAGARVIL